MEVIYVWYVIKFGDKGWYCSWSSGAMPFEHAFQFDTESEAQTQIDEMGEGEICIVEVKPLK